MSLLDIFKPKPAELACPRCEKSLAEHDEAACARRMSRRFFFQAVGGAAVAAAVPLCVYEVGADWADCSGITIIEEWRKENGIVTRRILSESRILLDEAIWPYLQMPILILNPPKVDPDWISFTRVV